MASKPISWRELMGEKNWDGLLDPLVPKLGAELNRYCKLIKVIEESFQREEDSPLVGLPRHSEDNLLSLAGLSSDYVVNKYVFASTYNIRPKEDKSSLGPRSGYSNWIGYVAVTTKQGTAHLGRREIVVAIRGTIRPEEWFPKFCMQELVPAHGIFPQHEPLNPKLQKGRYNYYTATDSHHSGLNSTSFRSQVLDAVKGLVAKYQSEKELSIVVTGFSMGGAFAKLIAADMVYNGYNKVEGRKKAVPVTAFAFAAAPLGDISFLNKASKFNDLHILRVKHESDLNTESPTEEDDYFHVGKELVIRMNVHDLNVYKQATLQLQVSHNSPPICPKL